MSARAGSFDIVLRYVPHHGWLYIIIEGGVEKVRGEFKSCASTALACGMATAERLGLGGAA